MVERNDIFGKFQIVEKLGQGGCGEVWKARDTELNRWVALKLLRAGGGDDEDIARFKREAQTAGALSHPNIAAVFEVGETEGRHYIAMQLIDGKTLRAAGRLERREAVRVIRDAAMAIDYAHQMGIVHRDLKPENLMVAAGHVYVMDFGLARAVQQGTTLTVSGTILGTPAYMAPEQARGRIAEIRPPTDVWALGATLYELLAGHAPFRGETPWDTLAKVVEQDPPPLTDTSRDLVTIVMKCLEKEPARRYPTARALADDLKRWLDGEPVQAHPPSLTYRLRKGLAKRKAPVVVAVVVLLALTPLLWMAWSRQGRAERALRLWSEVTRIIDGASEAHREGNRAQFRARLDHGMGICREHIDRDGHPHAHYFLGRLLRLTGRVPEADAALTRAVELDPALLEARFERGITRALRYNAGVALKTARTPLEIQYGLEGPTTDEVERQDSRLAALRQGAMEDLSVPVGAGTFFGESDLDYGRALLAQARGDAAEAVRLLQQILSRDPKTSHALLQLAQIAFDRGDFAESRKRAEEAIAVDRGLVEANRRRALSILAARDEGSLAIALGDMDRFVAEETPAANDHLVRGLILRRLKRNAEAREALDRAIELEPTNPHARVSRAQIRSGAGDAAGADEDLQAALDAKPDHPLALLARAILRRGRGENAGALQDLNQLEKAVPRLAMLYSERAGIKYRLGDTAGALADLDKALGIDGDHVESLALRAGIRRQARQLEGAMEDAERAVLLRSDHVEALRIRGWLRLEKNLLEGAVADFTRVIELDPSLSDGWAGRGLARHVAGAQGALEDLDEAVQRGDRSSEIQHMRGLMLKKRGEAARALEAFEAAIRIEPGHARALGQRGLLREAAGDAAGARRDYDAALSRDPRQAEVLMHRGEMRLADGDRDGAIADFEATLRAAPKGWSGRAELEKRVAELKR